MSWQQGKQRLLADLLAEIGRLLVPGQALLVKDFASQLMATFPAEDLKGRQLSDLYGYIVGSWAYLQNLSECNKVRVFNPEYTKHGWQLGHTVVSVCSPNMPFITDSVRGELNQRNITVHTIQSTIVRVIRNEQSELVELLPARSEKAPPKSCRLQEEVLLYMEIGRHSSQSDLDEIQCVITEILEDVAIVVSDFRAMGERCNVAQVDVASTPGLEQADLDELQAFLSWLSNRHFTFLGYEELAVEYDNGAPRVSLVADSQLGILRRRGSFSQVDLFNEINRASSNAPLSERQLIFSKSSVRSRVHRLVYPDYISVKRFDRDGLLMGEHRFMGLYTSQTYTTSPNDIPILRVKIARVLERSGLGADSHEGRYLARVLEVFPRDELFQSSLDELFVTAMAVNQIQERRQIRLFTRLDSFGKFVNCLVYTPRDIYRTELRAKIEQVLSDAYGAQECEFTTFFSESILTRTHFVLRVDPTKKIDVDVKALEEEIKQVTMSWQDHLHKYLLEEYGEEKSTKIFKDYGGAFPPGYMDDFEPRAAVDDIAKFSSLINDTDIAMGFYRVLGEDENQARFRLFHLDRPMPLSDVMPILENLGLRVLGERPYAIITTSGKKFWVHEFSLEFSLATTININKVSVVFQEAFSRVWFGDAESDAFNRLILGAELDWREIAMLRAYSRYMKQIQFGFSGNYIAETLANHTEITCAIVNIFNRRFDPDSSDQAAEDALEQEIITALDSVENLSEDRIIRQYLAIIKATLRTNFFQLTGDGTRKAYFSFKLFPGDIPDLPLPVPMFEIFVYSPWVEGVHLRGGKVARGGLRWSDRQEDFRTEVLGLVKAQQVKNAVIVPTGAKGGFVAKQLPGEGGREALQQEGVRCYKTFIQGLLDITDNLQGNEVLVPPRVVRKDEDDTYLVVAADKGTATFSDIANEISAKYDFWLGDAFASGGSVGYDHKKMGITAKGAWVSVQRHFREMGVDVQSTDFTVVGVGDMAGDVFGNGMLLSEHIQLVCAFNHLHIFVDPDPDSASSFKERQRLFDLPRSSWQDYNSELISRGGGIFLRSAKSITISDEMKRCFDIGEDKLTPAELIHAVLQAPVDLLWNGGIGTYIKSSAESHADVGDKANDVLRVDGAQLRCKVIGEGGNLGVTQLGRIEYALNGGRCNTDFIDNAAGVDCSDHEVNIKILLNAAMTAGDMTEKQRNSLLESMTDSVSELVLENNYRQTQAISLAEREALFRTGEYRRLIQGMEESGRLNRQLEFIPEDEVLMERRGNGKGLTRPELSVLISYTKSQLKEELVSSSVPENAYMAQAVETAFPAKLRQQYPELIHGHRLHREIVATQVANDLVNHMGITFIDRLSQSTGAGTADIAQAYITARDALDMHNLWEQVEALDYKVSAAIQMELMASLMRLVRRSSRWFVRNRRSELDPAAEISLFKAELDAMNKQLPSLVTGELNSEREKYLNHFLDAGVPSGLAEMVANSALLYPCLGVVDAAHSIDAPVSKVAEVYFLLAHELELDWFARQLADLQIENYWQAMARESYRDDLEWQLRALTVGAMRHLCSKGDVPTCIGRWMEQQSTMVERWCNLLNELHSAESKEFAMYSVAIRELLDMAQSSKFGEVDQNH